MTKALLKEILFLAVVILLFSTSCFFIHLNGSQNGGNVNAENGLRKKHFPAPWLKSSRRKVLFVELYTKVDSGASVEDIIEGQRKAELDSQLNDNDSESETEEDNSYDS